MERARGGGEGGVDGVQIGCVGPLRGADDEKVALKFQRETVVIGEQDRSLVPVCCGGRYRGEEGVIIFQR